MGLALRKAALGGDVFGEMRIWNNILRSAFRGRMGGLGKFAQKHKATSLFERRNLGKEENDKVKDVFFLLRNLAFQRRE